MAANLIHHFNIGASVHHHHHHHLKTPLPPPQTTTKPPNSLSFPKPPNSLSYPPLNTPSPPQNNSLFRLLQLSTQHNDTHLTKSLHASILKLQHNTHLLNHLLSTYLQLGRFNYARKLFDAMPSPDVVSYSTLISCFAKSGKEADAVRLFFQMRGSGIQPNEYTFVALLTACMRLLDIHLGSQIQAFAVKSGYVDYTYVTNALMGLYRECGHFDSVVRLFGEMPVKDTASWNTIMSCLVEEGMYERSFELCRELLSLGEGLDYFTISSLLVACARASVVSGGREFHAYALKTGYGSNLSVNNALIKFYSNCGDLSDVERLFEKMPIHDVFTWNEMINVYMAFGLTDMAVKIFNRMPEINCVSYTALLSGFCHNGDGFRGLKLFCRLLEEGIELSDFTLTSVLSSCGLVMDRRTSEQIHAFVLKFGFGSNDHIETAVLDMCTRCGRMDDAEKIFYRITKSNSIMLASLACGYARISEPEKAIRLICDQLYVEPDVLDEEVLASALSICGELGFQKLGEQFHCHALKRKFLSEIGVGNATVSMYANCGDMEQAIKVFNRMCAHDIVSWNALLTGHIRNRQGDKGLATWENMQSSGIKPDSTTCHLVISAYRHTSLNMVEYCHKFFLSMESIYHIEPTSNHYACLVRVLGYWGLVDEAEKIIDKMPFEPNASVWRALLDGNRVHPDSRVGRRAVKKILEMDPQDPSTYILKSNLYSASGRWHCSEVVREEMRNRGFRKIPARSWFIHENKVLSFFARDKSHLLSKDIYSALEILFKECLKVGYVPDTSFVLHEVEEHQKIHFLLYHSAKLAVAYGILATRPGKPVKVMKNIHLCGDCHAFLKCISVVTKREIHVRDSSGFHCFVDGTCLCKSSS